MRLRKQQREALLQWVAAGQRSDEINQRAAAFDPPFTVSRSQVDFYRKTRETKLEEIKQADEFSALTTGTALKDERVRRLQIVEDKMFQELTGDSLWVTDAKQVGGQVVYVTKFNEAEMQQWRGVLDDIAKEVGGRTSKQEISGPNGGPIETVNIYIPDNGRQGGS